MDLKTFLFVHGINIKQFARHMGMGYFNALKIVDRALRPRAKMAAKIQHASNGLVTVDELLQPYKYPVSWPGDKARAEYKNRVNVVEVSPDELNTIPKLVGNHNTIGEKMDRQIKKVKVDVKKGAKKKALKDVNKLLKMDKKYDAKLAKCKVKVTEK